MRYLMIDQLSIRTSTNDGLYGVDIPFVSGLNIIHAENTHGKSTCIQSIIFALGLEGCLGPSRKAPLKTALTSQLRMADNLKATIFESIVYLQISNGLTTITVSRCSNPDKLKLISVYQDATTEQAIDRSIGSHDYFLHDEGSATRERGFHCFLSEFLGITQPKVMKYNGSESPLYLESIFSINYVEQTRGWGGILNILPTYFGIKELSERIIEYTLDLKVQKHAKKREELSKKKKDAERIWSICVDSLIDIAKGSTGYISNELNDKINKDTTVSTNTYLSYHADNELNSYHDRIKHLKSELTLLRIRNSNYKADDHKVPRLEEELAQQVDLLAEQENVISLLISDLNTSDKYTRSIEQRIHGVKDSLRKYKDLERLESIGSKEDFQLIQNKCPTCNAKIEDSLLSHVQSESIKILGLEDNIKYLEKQKETFAALLKGEKKNSQKKEIRLGVAESKLNNTREIIREIKNSLIDESSVLSRSDIKKELIIESNIQSFEKALRQEDEIKGKLQEALSEWKFSVSALNALPSNGLSGSDWSKLKMLKASFISNLGDFGYSSNDLGDFEISHRSYKPTLNDVDINSEASASDNIRVIWSYLYSILTLDQKNVGNTNHLGLLIMDEPRQQEAKNESFAKFISKAADVKRMNKQVIIGTSENYNELKTAIKSLDVNVCHFETDIIRKIC